MTSEKREKLPASWDESKPIHEQGSISQVEKLIEQNLKLTEEIYEMTKKIKRYITFQKVVSFIYLLLIVVPIILGAIYLPPLLKNVFSQYKDLLGMGQNPIGSVIENSNQLDLGGIDFDQLSPELKRLLGQ